MSLYADSFYALLLESLFEAEVEKLVRGFGDVECLLNDSVARPPADVSVRIFDVSVWLRLVGAGCLPRRSSLSGASMKSSTSGICAWILSLNMDGRVMSSQFTRLSTEWTTVTWKALASLVATSSEFVEVGDGSRRVDAIFVLLVDLRSLFRTKETHSLVMRKPSASLAWLLSLLFPLSVSLASLWTGSALVQTSRFGEVWHMRPTINKVHVQNALVTRMVA